MNIKKKLPTVNHRLISIVLSEKEFNIDCLLKLFEDKNLQIAQEEFNNIKNYLQLIIKETQ